MNPPQVDNVFKQGNFIIHIKSYKTMSRTLMIRAVSDFMKSKRLRSLPKSGEVTIYSHYGASEELTL